MGKFDIAHIDPFICTHIIYTFFGVSLNDITYLDPYLDLSENWGRDHIRRFIGLKQKNPDVRNLPLFFKNPNQIIQISSS
jgi:chitinase